MAVSIGIPDGIKIAAFNFQTGLKVGEYNSIAQAARKLFIRNDEVIRGYLYGTKGHTFRYKKRGVKSYKGGVYHFELIK